jgi:hypothetical protein
MTIPTGQGASGHGPTWAGPAPQGPIPNGQAQQGWGQPGPINQQGQVPAGSWQNRMGQASGAVAAQLPAAAPQLQLPAGPPPVPGLPGPSGNGSFAAASRRIPFSKLVLVELRKLTGTLSDRILLALAPVVLVGITVLSHVGSDKASSFASAADQISPTYYTVRVGHVLLHAVLIKLIAGEWQHRSAQPTLLAQPSRARYFLAQATVVLMLWVRPPARPPGSSPP